jgi:hypothetical protein
MGATDASDGSSSPSSNDSIGIIREGVDNIPVNFSRREMTLYLIAISLVSHCITFVIGFLLRHHFGGDWLFLEKIYLVSEQ